MKRITIYSLSSFYFNFRFFSQIKAEKRKTWYDKDRREYLKKYANEFKITHYSQWYSVNGQKLLARPDATGIFSKYDDSLAKALAALFPEVKWKPWLFERVSKDFWKDTSNQRKFIEDLLETKGLKNNFEDLQKITRSDIIKHKGKTLLLYHDGVLSKLLKVAFPEYVWQPWHTYDSGQWWQDKKNHRTYLEELGKIFKFTSFEDYYKLTIDMIESNYGSSLLRFYQKSPMKAVMSVFPEYPWQWWRFELLPRNYWGDERKVKEFIEYVEKKFNMESADEWYLLNKSDIIEAGGNQIYVKYKGLIPFLQRFYRQYKWSEEYKIKLTGKTKQQLYFLKNLWEIFPHEILVQEYKLTDALYGLDAFLPALKYGFSFEENTNEEKRKLCKQKGIVFIEIPKNWDKKKQSLEKLIQNEVKS